MKMSHQIRTGFALLLAWLQLAFLYFTPDEARAAQGPITAVQDALRREQVYFGEATGVVDDGTREALKRFQLRHGLPLTGEIDGDTLQTLQNSAEERRPVVRSLPVGAQAGEVTALTVRKDRAFLMDLEKAQRSNPWMSVTAPVASAEIPPSPIVQPAVTQGQGPVKALPSVVAEAPSPSAASAQKSSRLTTPSPARRTMVATPVSRLVEVQREPLDVRGSRSIRTTTTIVDPNARERGHEARTRNDANTPPPSILRRAEPVESRKKEGFFHRLFKGHHEDDDDEDDD